MKLAATGKHTAIVVSSVSDTILYIVQSSHDNKWHLSQTLQFRCVVCHVKYALLLWGKYLTLWSNFTSENTITVHLSFVILCLFILVYMQRFDCVKTSNHLYHLYHHILASSYPSLLALLKVYFSASFHYMKTHEICLTHLLFKLSNFTHEHHKVCFSDSGGKCKM